MHRSNGTIERIVPDELAAFDVVRTFLSYLPGSVFALPPVTVADDPPDRREGALLAVVPRNSRHPYDVGTILEGVFDRGSVFRYAGYGGGTLTCPSGWVSRGAYLAR